MSLPHMDLARADAVEYDADAAELRARVAEVRERIDAAVARGGHRQTATLVAVTKTHPAGAVRAAWEAGVHDVGENRVQEALPKMAALDVPVRWHLIGHLQRNKARQTDGFALVHSCDSPRGARGPPGATARGSRTRSTRRAWGVGDRSTCCCRST